MGIKIEDLSDELKEKALACKGKDELVELAKSEGVELTDEQLDAIAGGDWVTCPLDDCSNHHWC